MRKQTESRIYIAAFSIVAILAVTMCSYCDGRTDEALRESHDTDQEIDNAIAERELWHDKYISLTQETDAVTVMAAEERLEEGRK